MTKTTKAKRKGGKAQGESCLSAVYYFRSKNLRKSLTRRRRFGLGRRGLRRCRRRSRRLFPKLLLRGLLQLRTAEIRPQRLLQFRALVRRRASRRKQRPVDAADRESGIRINIEMRGDRREHAIATGAAAGNVDGAGRGAAPAPAVPQVSRQPAIDPILESRGCAEYLNIGLALVAEQREVGAQIGRAH